MKKKKKKEGITPDQQGLILAGMAWETEKIK